MVGPRRLWECALRDGSQLRLNCAGIRKCRIQIGVLRGHDSSVHQVDNFLLRLIECVELRFGLEKRSVLLRLAFASVACSNMLEHVDIHFQFRI